MTSEQILIKLSDQKWRLDNLYTIIPEVPVDGKSIIQFKLREAQKELLDNLHTRVIINKCRKIGYSSLLALLCLDSCLFNKNFRASVVDFKEVGAYLKLDMIRDAWYNSEKYIDDPAIRELWKGIKYKIKLTNESKSELRFSNGSIFTASTSTMGSSPQLLWISELGPLSNQAPDRAAKLKRGSLNSVAPDATLIIESTAEGATGVFYDLLQLALETKDKDVLEKTEYRLIFRPWQDHPSYKIDKVFSDSLDQSTIDYFTELEKNYNIYCTDGQKLWYQIKFREIGDDMFSQYPSTFEESVRNSTSGAIYPQMMNVKSSGKVRKLTFEPAYPLYTSWDLGINDATAGILFQICGKDLLVHRFYSGTGFGADKVAKIIKSWEREFNADIEKNFLPHDAARRDVGSAKPYISFLTDAGINSRQLTIIPVCKTRWNGIRIGRNLLSKTWFDIKCNDRFSGMDGESLPSLIQCLENYKKNPKSGEPLHDIYSNGADSFRYIAEAMDLNLLKSITENKNRSINRNNQQKGDFVY
jgi:hypothetical protein